MREILFRGKRIDNGEWVYGYYFIEETGGYLHRDGAVRGTPSCFIMDNNMETFEINPKTVGQFTGLLDKNGVKIFEGDIVDFGFGRGEVWFDDGTFKHIFVEKGEDGGLINSVRPSKRFWDKLEVIGNIFDNPELLEVELLNSEVVREWLESGIKAETLVREFAQTIIGLTEGRGCTPEVYDKAKEALGDGTC